MKKALILFFLIASFSVMAQSDMPGRARAYDDMSIVLNSKQTLQPVYMADVSHYGDLLAVQSKALQLQADFSKPYAVCVVDKDSKTMTITLGSNTVTQNWTIADWNNYLKN